MKLRCLCAPAVLAMMALAAPAPAQDGHHPRPGPGAGAHPAHKAVNEMCPIGKEPIDGRTFITYDGDVVGFCCPGCDEEFLGWEKERRDAFIADAKAAAAPPEEDPAAKAVGAEAGWSGVYPLADCPVSGKPLGSMGEPVAVRYDGREVRFCCAGCPPRFEADRASYFRKIDERIVAMQLPYYPLRACIVSGGRLGSMGKPDDYVYRNRLVRFCCAGCREGFEENFAAHLAALDKAAAEEQRPAYPLTSCPVSGEPLGSMGGPAEAILAGRLVRLCCAHCEEQLRKEPAKVIRELDEAWRKAGRPGIAR